MWTPTQPSRSKSVRIKYLTTGLAKITQLCTLAKSTCLSAIWKTLVTQWANAASVS